LRIELFMTLLAGFAGGLCGTLWAGLVTTPLLARVPSLRSHDWQPESAIRVLLGAAVHGAAGAAAGLLFWLSWGLVAVVAAPWPALGASFGALVWLAGAMPAFAALALRRRGSPGVLVLTAAEMLVACVAAGMLCAYVWHRAA
jgi:hypothetical protein